MGRPYLVCSLSVAAVFTAVAPAHAQVAVEWQVAGTATLGFTDNADGTPEPENEGDPGPQPDGFLTVTPSLELMLETPDATHSLGYGVGYTLYFINTEISSFNQALSYGVRAPVREGLDIAFALSGSQTTMSEFAILSAAPGGQAQATQANDNVIFAAGSGLGITAQVGPTWDFSWAAAGAYAHTVVPGADDTQTTTGSMSANLSTYWERDRLGFSQSNDMQYSPAQLVGTIDADDSLQFLHRASVDWAHQWAQDWETTATAGVLVAYDIYATIGATGEFEDPDPQPSGSASVRWTPRRGTLSLSYSHDAAPNLLLRQITLNDTGTVSGLVDLPRGVDLGGSAGVQVSQSYLSADNFSPGVSFLLDVAVGWIPPKALMRLEARYQFTRQFAIDEGADELLFPNMERHTALLTTTFAFPRPPNVGGVRRGVILPSPTANVEFISEQAPYADRAIEDQMKEDPDSVDPKDDPRPADDD